VLKKLKFTSQILSTLFLREYGMQIKKCYEPILCFIADLIGVELRFLQSFKYQF